MTFALIFWVLMLIWLVFGLANHFGAVPAPWAPANNLFLFILFLLLGWHVFGTPVHS